MTRLHYHCRMIAGLLFLFLGTGNATAGSGAATFDWTAFGKRVAAAMPPEVKSASTLRQMHYLAERVADQLGTLGITPNFDQDGRDNAQRRFQDSSLGTCGQTALCLQQTCQGAGIAARLLKTAVVIKRGHDGQVPQELNADHAALMLVTADGAVVFDLWADGRTHKTFAHFPASCWKGMPLAEWGRRMSLEGYTIASVQEHPEIGETTPMHLPALLRQLQGAGEKKQN